MDSERGSELFAVSHGVVRRVIFQQSTLSSGGRRTYAIVLASLGPLASGVADGSWSRLRGYFDSDVVEVGDGIASRRCHYAKDKCGDVIMCDSVVQVSYPCNIEDTRKRLIHIAQHQRSASKPGSFKGSSNAATVIASDLIEVANTAKVSVWKLLASPPEKWPVPRGRIAISGATKSMHAVFSKYDTQKFSQRRSVADNDNVCNDGQSGGIVSIADTDLLDATPYTIVEEYVRRWVTLDLDVRITDRETTAIAQSVLDIFNARKEETDDGDDGTPSSNNSRSIGVSDISRILSRDLVLVLTNANGVRRSTARVIIAYSKVVEFPATTDEDVASDGVQHGDDGVGDDGVRDRGFAIYRVGVVARELESKQGDTAFLRTDLEAALLDEETQSGSCMGTSATNPSGSDEAKVRRVAQSVDDAISAGVMVDVSSFVVSDNGPSTCYVARSFVYDSERRAARNLARLINDKGESDGLDLIDGLTMPLKDALVAHASASTPDMKLSDGQILAMSRAMIERVSVITGLPGGGKSLCVSMMLSFISKHAPHVLRQGRTALLAPTGKAVARLRETLREVGLSNDVVDGLEPRTAHRWIAQQAGRGKGQGDHTKQRPQPIFVIVDEVSMLDIATFERIVCNLPTGSRMVLIGDDAQLPSVGPGNVLSDIVATGMIRHTHLAKAFRQSGVLSTNGNNNDGAMRMRSSTRRLMYAIADVRAGRVPTVISTGFNRASTASEKDEGGRGDADDADEEDDDSFRFVNTGTSRDLLRKATLSLVKQYAHVYDKKDDDLLVLTPMNATVSALRDDLQKALNPSRVVGTDGDGTDADDGDVYGEWLLSDLSIGDRVMQIVNHYDDNGSSQRFNGQTGNVVSIKSSIVDAVDHGRRGNGGNGGGREVVRTVQVSFDGGARIEKYIDRSVMVDHENNVVADISLEQKLAMQQTALQLVHAVPITIHKSQGSQADTVVVCIPFDSPFNTRNLIYTAVSRAKKRCIVVGSHVAFTNAISRMQRRRCTMLRTLTTEALC